MEVTGQRQQLEQVTTVAELADVVRTYARVAAIGAYWARAHVPTDLEQRRVLELADAAADLPSRIGLDTAP